MKWQPEAKSGIVKWALYGLGFWASLLLAFGVFILYGLLPNRWYHLLVVTSGSMAPTFEAGDLIVITRPPETLQTGMVVTLMVNGEVVTHRLAGIAADGELITFGDANQVLDDWNGSKVSVHGLYQGRIPKLGWLIHLAPPALQGDSTGGWFADSDQIAFSIASSGRTPTFTPTLPPTETLVPADVSTVTLPPDTPTFTPTPSETPEGWDQSDLTFGPVEVTCDEGGMLSVEITNIGEPMAGPVRWSLLLMKKGKVMKQVGEGEVPPLYTDQSYLIREQVQYDSIYKFSATQRPGHEGQGVLWSEQVYYNPLDCPSPDAKESLPTPELASPTPTPTQTELPPERPTYEPPMPTATLEQPTVPPEPPTATSEPPTATLEPPTATPEPPTATLEEPLPPPPTREELPTPEPPPEEGPPTAAPLVEPPHP